jgi:hypothetical protein
MPKLKPQIKTIDCTTGEEIVRDATVDEIAQMELDAVEAQAHIEARAQKEIERQALLDRLGITADEAKLLLG